MALVETAESRKHEMPALDKARGSRSILGREVVIDAPDEIIARKAAFCLQAAADS